MFCPPNKQIAKNSKILSSLKSSFILILLLVGTDSVGQFSKSPDIVQFENLLLNQQLLQSRNLAFDTISPANYSETTFFVNSVEGIKYSNNYLSNDSSLIMQAIFNQKIANQSFSNQEISVLKTKRYDRIRGSRTRLGIYMTVAGISIIVAALIINSKN